MDRLECPSISLDVFHKYPSRVDLLVTPGRSGKFTLSLLTDGNRCMFQTERGLSKIISKEFAVSKIMRPQACSMAFTLVSKGTAFPALATIKAQTDQSQEPIEIDIRIQNNGV